MRRPKLPRPARQLGLFHGPIHLPSWTALPMQVRQAVLPLLKDLLKAAALQAARDGGVVPDGDHE